MQRTIDAPDLTPLRDLQLEVNRVQAQKNVIDQTVREALQSLSAANERVLSLEREHGDLERRKKELEDLALESIASSRRALSGLERDVVGLLALLKGLEKRAEAEEARTLKARQEAEAVHQVLLSETEVMDRQWTDLRTYAKRLTDKYKELLPDFTIKL